MEKRIGTVNPPIIMNTFVNEAFEEGDDKIVENNNSTWGNVNLDEMLQTGDIDKTKMSQLLNIPGTPRTRDRKISQICAKVRQEADNMGTYSSKCRLGAILGWREFQMAKMIKFLYFALLKRGIMMSLWTCHTSYICICTHAFTGAV